MSKNIKLYINKYNNLFATLDYVQRLQQQRGVGGGSAPKEGAATTPAPSVLSSSKTRSEAEFCLRQVDTAAMPPLLNTDVGKNKRMENK
jgi:hypothetical protein